MRYTVIGPMSVGVGWRVHKEGCKDIAKDQRLSCGQAWTVEAASVDILLESEVKSLDDSFGGPGESGYSKDDFQILPCCK